MRLEDFDDFADIAQGCQNVFYQVRDLANGTLELIAYAGRVYWKQTFDSTKESTEFIDILQDLRAKVVLETSDQVFV